MKIKADFVTNSSSSSFVVAFPKKIRHLKDVQKFIPEKYAQTVFDDATKQKALSAYSPKVIKKVVETVNNGYINDPRFRNIWDYDKYFYTREGVPEYNSYSGDNPRWRNLSSDESTLKQNSFAHTYAQEFLEKVTNESYIYFFNYGDEDGEYFSEMEHNGIFEKLDHIQISQH